MESKLLTEKRFVDQKTGFTYRYVFSDTEYFRPHTHEYYELFLMLDGNALHKVNGAELPLGRGDLVFIRPFDDHDYICIDQKPFSMLNIAFSAKICEMLFEYLGNGFKKSHLLGAFLFAYKGWQKGRAKEYPTLFDTAGLYRKYSKKDVF